MKSRNFILVVTIAVVTVLSIPTGLAAQDATAPAKKADHHHYKLIDIGTLGGSSSCINEPLNFVPAVNSRGNTVGTSATAALETSTSNPTAINCGGGQNVFHGFEWRNGTVIDLGTLAGPDFNSDADSVNDRGVIEGVSENGLLDPAVGFNQVRAVIWKDGQIQDLGTLGGLHSWSFGINNGSQVVGMALNTVPDPVSMYGWVIFGSPNSTQTRAFLWQHDIMLDLGTLGGPDAWAWGINESGQVLGWSYTNTTPNPSSGFPTWILSSGKTARCKTSAALAE
jgi:probable HAF family extracellular repeat protein